MEYTGKYRPERAPRIETSPMVDAEVVLFAGRTAVDIGAPVAVGLMFLLVFGSFALAVLSPPVVVLLQPMLKRRFGRGRVLHLLWTWGLPGAGELPRVFTIRDGIAEFGP